MTENVGAADAADIVEFLGAVTDVGRMVSTRTIPVARAHGISERALGIITLVHAGLDRPGMLIEFLNVLPSTMTSDLDKLVGAGLLERSPLPSDRRVTCLKVTERGIAVQNESLERLHEYFRDTVSSVSLTELQDCIATLRKLSGVARPMVPNPLRPDPPGPDPLQPDEAATP